MEKDLNYYMNLNYKINIVKDEFEEGYALSYPQLKGCITVGENLEEGLKNLEDAKREWLYACLEDNIDIPQP